MQEFQDTAIQASPQPPNEPRKSVPLPIYDPKKQIKMADINLNYKGSYNDAVLYAIQVERTRVLHEKQAITAQPLFGLPNVGIMWAIDHMDSQVGREFQGHGFSAKVDPVQVLEDLMTKGIDSNPERILYTTEFARNMEAGAALGADYPKAEGGIVLLGEHGKHIRDSGIKYIVVGDEFINVVDLLRYRYPTVEIIPWHDAPKRLTSIHNAITGEEISAIELNDQNHPKYVDTRPDLSVIRNASLLNEVKVPSTDETLDNIEPW